MENSIPPFGGFALNGGIESVGKTKRDKELKNSFRRKNKELRKIRTRIQIF